MSNKNIIIMAKTNMVAFGLILDKVKLSNLWDDDFFGYKTINDNTFVYLQNKYHYINSNDKEIYTRYIKEGYYPKNQLIKKFKIKPDFFNVTKYEEDLFLEKMERIIDNELNICESKEILTNIKLKSTNLQWFIVQLKIKKDLFSPNIVQIILPIK